jgi:D-amino-acid dehydrogenase
MSYLMISRRSIADTEPDGRDVVVIGGGAVGLCCAYALQREGASVTVLEANAIGSGASWGNVGWITPSLAAPLAAPGVLRTGLRAVLQPRDSLVFGPKADATLVRWLWRFWRSSTPERFRDGVRALGLLVDRTMAELDGYREDGVEFESQDAGLLVAAMSAEGLAWLRKLFDERASAGRSGRLELLDGDAARDLEPALGDAVAAAAYTAADRCVRPETLCQGLAARIVSRGATVRTGTAVRGLRSEPGGIVAETAAGELRAGSAIVATGIDANSLLRPLGPTLPIVAAKGYSITLRGTGARPARPLYLPEPKVGCSPYRDALRIGGFFELGATSAAVKASRIEHLLAVAQRYLREWRPREDELAGPLAVAWAGSRPSTPDSLPFIGAVPGARGVYVAAGHGMLGMTLAPATGALLTELIMGRHVPALRPFGVAGRI